jgi:hypothetical protein
MVLPIAKIAPTAAAAAMVTYCCWPHLFAGPVRENRPAGKLPQVAATLLSPVFAEPAERNPFLARSNPEAAAESDKPNTKADNSAAPVTDADEADPIEHWVLNATLLRGDRQFAVINGRLYQPGERLAPADSPDSQFVVTQIDANEVVIRGPRRTLRLRYSDFAERPSSEQASASGRTRAVQSPRVNRPANHSAPKSRHAEKPHSEKPHSQRHD